MGLSTLSFIRVIAVGAVSNATEPLFARLARRLGLVVAPRADRWHAIATGAMDFAANGERPLVARVASGTAEARLGFLVQSCHPARRFMGDAGSLLLGFLLAAAGLLPPATGAANIGVAIVAPPLALLALQIGGSDVGTLALRLLVRSRDARCRLVGLLDDDFGKRYRRIGGVPIAGRGEDLKGAIQRLRADVVLDANEWPVGSSISDRLRDTSMALGVECRELATPSASIRPAPPMPTA